eukprot:jgi/Galph1/4298/GphlegSOOS_G2994.1
MALGHLLFLENLNITKCIGRKIKAARNIQYRRSLYKRDCNNCYLKRIRNCEDLFPRVGQVFQCPGKWKTETEFAIVEKVDNPTLNKNTFVDVKYLRRRSGNLFEIDKKRKKGWYAVADLEKVPVRRLESEDVWIIETPEKAPNISTSCEGQQTDWKSIYLRDYLQLKKKWIQNVLLVDIFGFGLTWICSSGLSYNFLMGSLCGLVYLTLLMENVDNIGRQGARRIRSAVSSVRFLFPLVPVTLIFGRPSLSETVTASGTVSALLFSMIGFSTYRIPLIFDALQSIKTALPYLSYPRTSNKMQTRQFHSSEEKPPQCVVFAGPSGVGKSTFIRKLLTDYPEIFEFSISHTTRKPREDEVDGISYYFVDEKQFLEDVAAGKFIEYAQVHGNFYGTSFPSVERVIQNGKVCLLDVDIQGVQAVKKSNLEARFIWIAAPSLEELERRLRKRKTETEETIQRRLTTAKEEILFALRSGIFDHTIVNEDIDVAYEELKNLLYPYLQK